MPSPLSAYPLVCDICDRTLMRDVAGNFNVAAEVLRYHIAERHGLVYEWPRERKVREALERG